MRYIYQAETRYVELELQVHYHTQKAVKVSDTGHAKDAVWLPFKFIRFDADELNQLRITTIRMPEWLAKEKGLI